MAIHQYSSAHCRHEERLMSCSDAHITHANRVIGLLGLKNIFEGITYCDYAAKTLLCKPHPAMFEKAEKEAGAQSLQNIYFVGMWKALPTR